VSAGREPAPRPAGLGRPGEEWPQPPVRVRLGGLTLLKRLTTCAARLPQPASHSSRPPSPEAPAPKRQRRRPAAARRKPGGTPGPPGPPQVRLAPPAPVALLPEGCAGGHREGGALPPSRPHPVLELPGRRPAVTPGRLPPEQGLAGGTRGTATVPAAQGRGEGPRLPGCVGARAGLVGASRRAGQALGPSGFGRPRSQGALQTRGARVSAALLAHDTASGAVARVARVPASAEPAGRTGGARPGLWGRAPPRVADCQSPPHRSQGAWAPLLADWPGVLVSEGALVSPSGPGLGPRGWAPLRRTAKGLTEPGEAGMARGGARVHAALHRRWPRGPERPTGGPGRAWSARCRSLSHRQAPRADKAGTGARRGERAGEALGGGLDVEAVEATQKSAAGAHRCGVLWRTRSQGPWREKGQRWGERGLALRHTCRIRGRPPFPRRVAAVACLFTGARPALNWSTQPTSLPIPSTP
jgi:hypothetical protein